jgi:hypothetical protein
MFAFQVQLYQISYIIILEYLLLFYNTPEIRELPTNQLVWRLVFIDKVNFLYNSDMGIDKLKSLNMRYPPTEEKLDGIAIE